jgi:hypothetical protein
MSENEINLLMTVMNKGFDRIDGSIKDSRTERQGQIQGLHVRLNEHSERIKALEVAHAENMNKHCEPENIFGTFKTKNWRVTGLAAVAVSIGVAFAIAKTCNWL